MVHSFLSYWGVARDTWVVCMNRQKYLKFVCFGAAVSNVLSNLLLIPAWGASGAAFASLLAQIITTMVISFFIPELKENSILMIEGVLLKGLGLN